MLLIRKPWDSQPQESAQSAPIDGLRFLIGFGGGQVYDVKNNGRGSLVSTAKVSPVRERYGSALGLVLNGSSDYAQIPSNPAYDILSELTLIWGGTLTDFSSFNMLATRALSAGSANNPFEFRTNQTNGRLNLTRASASGFAQWETSAGVSSGSPIVCAVSQSGNLNNGNPASFYVNGASVASTQPAFTGSTAATGNSEPLLLGTRTSGLFHKGSTYFLAGFDRILTAAEVAFYSDYCWSAFAPRSIWVPVSAAGGGYTLTASPGAYTLSGQAAAITRSRALTASPGSYTLSGQAATITRNRALTASSGAYTLSGQAATITRNRALTASSGAYTLSGQAATITYTPGTGTTYTLTASAGAYTLSGQVASLLYGRLLVAGAGSYAVTGQAATITYTPAALPTVGRPASDTSNSGWTASTGSDLYAMINEVTPDAANYIVTTSTGSICEMPLQTTAYPGTSAQKLSYRASSSTGNSVIVRLKNTGGATVRTETQALTATDALYEITLTSGEIAAITSGALSVQLESA